MGHSVMNGISQWLDFPTHCDMDGLNPSNIDDEFDVVFSSELSKDRHEDGGVMLSARTYVHVTMYEEA